MKRTDTESLGFTLIRQDDIITIESLLRSNGWMEANESIALVEPAGEGNMNCTLRVDIEGATKRSIVLKQSRPWVEKYPSIEAPVNRSWHEYRFYQLIGGIESLARQTPKLIGSDLQHHLLCLQYIEDANDLTGAYADLSLPLDQAIKWLRILHSVPIDPQTTTSLKNFDLRTLNHQHIFQVPFASELPIDLDRITPGLETFRQRVIEEVSSIVLERLGQRYLATGHHSSSSDSSATCLLHGDYYPGSFLQRVGTNGDADDFFVIDPEFCFVGPPEFDWGILLAHSVFCGWNPDDAISRIQPACSSTCRLDLTAAFAAVEILRRLLGVAQLPIDADLQQKTTWIELALTWLSTVEPR